MGLSPCDILREKTLTPHSYKVSQVPVLFASLIRACKVPPALAVTHLNLITVDVLPLYLNISMCYSVLKKKYMHYLT